MASPKQTLGYDAEEKACAYLKSQGLILIEQNFQLASGEIDLIMQDGEYVVFVEVRSRERDYREALESITSAKQHKVIKTAMLYLLEKNCFNKVDCRFDVIVTDNTEIHWIKNAFSIEAFT